MCVVDCLQVYLHMYTYTNTSHENNNRLNQEIIISTMKKCSSFCACVLVIGNEQLLSTLLFVVRDIQVHSRDSNINHRVWKPLRQTRLGCHRRGMR